MIIYSLGTSLSRVHQSVFTEVSTQLTHSLFDIVDYILLETYNTEPEVTRSRQDMLCKTNISFFLTCQIMFLYV